MSISEIMVQPEGQGEWDAPPHVFSAYPIWSKGLFPVPLHNICWTGDTSPSQGWGVETGNRVSGAMLKCCQNCSWHRRNYPCLSCGEVLLAQGDLSLDYQTNKVLGSLVSAIDEQRPCQGRLRGDLVSAQGRNSSCFSPLKECDLWISQPAWPPYPSARAPALTGTLGSAWGSGGSFWSLSTLCCKKLHWNNLEFFSEPCFPEIQSRCFNELEKKNKSHYTPRELEAAKGSWHL